MNIYVVVNEKDYKTLEVECVEFFNKEENGIYEIGFKNEHKARIWLEVFGYIDEYDDDITDLTSY